MFPQNEKLPSPTEQKEMLEKMFKKVEQQGFCATVRATQMGIDPKVISDIRNGDGTASLSHWRLLKNVFGDD